MRLTHQGILVSVFILATSFDVFSSGANKPPEEGFGTNQLREQTIEQLALPLKYTTETYQNAAFDLVLREANLVAQQLHLPEKLPITRTDVVDSYISPLGTAQHTKRIGKIATRRYAYYVSNDNKFCYLDSTSQEEDYRRWQAQYSWPLAKLDTNGAYQMATQWLASAAMDVEALNHDCQKHIQAGVLKQRSKDSRFLPIYWVYWTKGGEGQGCVASVKLFMPTKALVQLRVEQSKYILRQPLQVTNSAANLSSRIQ